MTRPLKAALAGLGLLAAGVLLPVEARAQDSGPDHVLENFRRFEAANPGMSLLNSRSRQMSEGYVLEYNFELTEGVNYVFAGMCDENCSSMRMFVKDSSGQILERVTTSVYVAVSMTPSSTGTYTVSYVMSGCRYRYPDPGCHAGMRQYRFR